MRKPTKLSAIVVITVVWDCVCVCLLLSREWTHVNIDASSRSTDDWANRPIVPSPSTALCCTVGLTS